MIDRNRFAITGSTYLSLRSVKTILSILTLFFILITAGLQAFPAHAAPVLELTPITWNVIGLDSNNVNTGPNNFPVGVRVCNTGPDEALDVTASYVWDTANPYINLRTTASSWNTSPVITIPSLPAGECYDFYFEIEITRLAAAYTTTREYHIEVTSSSLPGVTLSTPTPRELFVEYLVSQERNTVDNLYLDGDLIPAGGTMTLFVGSEYTVLLEGSTAPNGYEQIETFVHFFPNTIFQILGVTTTYTANSGSDPDASTKLYADGCSWINDPASPDYLSCINSGPNFKYGGDVTVEYHIRIIGGGGTNNILNTLIYDYSGSSYHYNNDFDSSARLARIVEPDPRLSIVKTAAPPTYNAVGNVISYSYTVTNAGNVPLTGPFSVTDDKAMVTCTQPADGELSPGESMTCSASYTIIQADLDAGSVVNTAYATGYYNTTLIQSPDDSATVTAIQSPALSLTKSAAPITYSSVGEIITYTLTATNTGNVTLTAVQITDPGLTLTNFVCVPPQPATLAPTQSLVCTGDYTITQADLDAGSVLNTATATGVTPNNVTLTQTANETITAVQTPALTIVKTATPSTYNAVGQTISYSYLVTNSGNVTLYNISVVDDKAMVSCPDTSAGLAPLAQITCTASYTITQADLDNGSVTNSAYATDGATNSPPDDETVTAVPAPALTIVKNATPSTYNAVGNVISYSYLVTNSGNVTLNGPFSVSDDKATDEACTQPADGALSPGESMTCTASYTITQADLDNGFVTNIASATNGTVTSPTDTETVTAVLLADLEILKTDSADPVTIGDAFSYILSVTNYGPSTATSVVVVDTLPPGVGFVSASGTGWSCGQIAITVTCTRPSLDVGTAPDITISVTAPAVPGLLINTTVVSSATSDPNLANNTDSETTLVVDQEADLRLSKTVDNATPDIGGSVTFTVTLTNDGPNTATNVQVRDDLPAGLSFVSATTSQGTFSSGTGIWTVGTLANGSSATLTITATVNVTGPYENIAQVSASDQPDPDSTPNNDDPNEDDQDNASVTPNPPTPSQIAKTVTATNAAHTTDPDVAIGEIVTYQVVVNISPGQYSNAQMVDTLDRGLAFVSCQSISASSADLTTSVNGGFSGICGDTTGTNLVVDDPVGANDPRDAGRRVTFDFGSLTNNGTDDEQLTLIYRTVVLDSAGNVAGKTLANRAVFAWTGGSLEAVSSSLVIREPDLTISKTVDSTLAGQGSVITFTITINHTALSRTNAYDTEVADTLPTELDYVAGTLNCTTGAQDPNLACSYDAATRTIRARWSNFALGGGEGIVRFSVRILTVPANGIIDNVAGVTWTSLPGDPGVQSPYNTLSTERYYDPDDPSGVNVYSEFTTLRLNLISAGLPETGFAPGLITDLGSRPQTSYASTGNLTLEIPSLGVELPIVGVPLKNGDWDLNWLDGQAGWLQGTAFPSWRGNSLITAHVIGANGLPGPFYDLSKLRWGDRIIVYAYGGKYIYEVRGVQYLEPEDMSALRHEERAWVTLITCKEYDPESGTYLQRVAVRAVLVSFESER